jgi:hypothetical protein
MDLRGTEGYDLDWIHVVHNMGPVSGCCEDTTELPSSIKVGGLVGQLGDYQLILLGLSPLWHRKNIDVIRIKI